MVGVKRQQEPLVGQDGKGRIITYIKGTCACGRESGVFINENGKTFCLKCDEERGQHGDKDKQGDKQG